MLLGDNLHKGWALSLGLLWTACEAGESAPVPSETSQAIVYGKDDRREVYEAPSEIRDVARSALVGLVPRSRVQRPASGEVKLIAVPLSVAYGLCESEPFSDQPTAADCTGVLIDDDLVVTAGHCFEGNDCNQYAYVFDYYYRADGELEALNSSDVYGCRKLVAQEISERNGKQIDYAIVQLDRPALGRRPVAVRATPAGANEPMVVLGMGSGLPLKVDEGARVVSARSDQHDYFMLEADTFQGSSGSAVLDRDESLLGVLVRGGTDYVKDPVQDCQVTNRVDHATDGTLPDGDLAHEEATYASVARDGLCARGFPSVRLCNIAPTCGDTFCTGTEDRDSCALDCDPCTGDSCGARGSLRVEQRDEVKQSAGTGLASATGGCSVSARSQRQAPGALWLVLVGALLCAGRRLGRLRLRQRAR